MRTMLCNYRKLCTMWWAAGVAFVGGRASVAMRRRRLAMGVPVALTA